MTRLAPSGECDPVKPSYVHCAGMHAVFGLPCSHVRSHISYPDDLTLAVDWRTAVIQAKALADQVVPQPYDWTQIAYHIQVFAQFKWASRKQSHFAQYTYWPTPTGPPEKRCVHLFTNAFKWTAPSYYYPDPINEYPLFRAIYQREDGTPDVTFNLSEWHWSFPQEPMFYTEDEWKNITAWEQTMFHYNHQLKICTAKHDYLGQWVTETRTERQGRVIDILPPRRETEVWDPLMVPPPEGPVRKHWMKYRPLIYVVRMADDTIFKTTRRSLTYWTPEVVEITYD